MFVAMPHNRAIKNHRDSLLDDWQRQQEPLTGAERLAESIIDFDVKSSFREKPVQDVFEFIGV